MVVSKKTFLFYCYDTVKSNIRPSGSLFLENIFPIKYLSQYVFL